MIIFNKRLSQEEVQSHIRTLYLLAGIDQKLMPSEMEYLYVLGLRNRLNAWEVDQIIANQADIGFKLPDDPEARIQQLYELIKMMLVDNRLDEREAALCVRVAEEMGFNKTLVGGLVRTLVTCADDKTNIALSKKELEYYINHPDLI
jgi:uncharacterized tellurite resistance protein B-like protein